MSSASPSAARKGSDSGQAKGKRRKRLLAAGSVILLALLGYQLPKLLGEKTSSPAGTAPSVVAPTTSSLSSTGGLSAPARLPDTDRVVVQPQSGQLLAFGLFKSKDPFVQQLSTVQAAASSSPSSAGSHVPPRPAGTTGSLVASPAATTASATAGAAVSFPSTTSVATTPVATTPVATTPVPASTTPATPASTQPAATTAVPATTPGTVAISTNGRCELVPVKSTFPGDEDIFRVTSIAKDGKSVKIAVVGGSYDSGQATATLRKDRKLTLVNTADGTRYAMTLKNTCDPEPQPVPSPAAEPAQTTAPQSAPPPATTAPTTTEPIVEDEEDSGEAETTATE